MTTSQPQPEPEVTVTMPRSYWAAILNVEPLTQETYTPDGITLFNAFQYIHWAMNKAAPESWPPTS